MKQIVVYKLRRIDNKEYIGITETFKKRLYDHKRSKRFRDLPIIDVQILNEFDDYDQGLLFEERAIEKYDTYRNGLNKTPSGQGNHHSPNFTTKGKRLSESTKEKIGLKSRERRAGKQLARWMKERSPEDVKASRERISQSKRGCVSFVKFRESEITALIQHFNQRPFLEKAGQVQRNGKILSYERAFSNMFADQYNMTSVMMYKILTGKTIVWKQQYDEIIALRS